MSLAPPERQRGREPIPPESCAHPGAFVTVETRLAPLDGTVELTLACSECGAVEAVEVSLSELV